MSIIGKKKADCREIQIYHCTVRCVRHAFLCGEDPQTGKDFGYRRQWFRDRLNFLGGIFVVEVISYSLRPTYLHIILRTRPDLAEELTDMEVARRWVTLYAFGPFHKKGTDWDPPKESLDLIVQDVDRAELYRQRLTDISWFMRHLNEFIARKANHEDNCKGHFWESGFKRKLLQGEEGLLAGMVEVYLNPLGSARHDSRDSLYQ